MDRAPRAYIIDAMAVVQCIKKTPSMTSILHFKTASTARIERMVIGYMEVRANKCLVPRAVVELVKCGCKGECKGNCSCAKNVRACTRLCKCCAAGFNNNKDYHGDDQDEDTEKEGDFD